MARAAFVMATPVASSQARRFASGARQLRNVRAVSVGERRAARSVVRASLQGEQTERGAAAQPTDSSQSDEWNAIRDGCIWMLGICLAMSDSEAAHAIPDGVKDAFKSIPASLVHPAVMWVLLGTCVYTFYLGYQSSLIRKSDAERRKQLVKKQVTLRHFQTSSALFAVMTLATFGGMANTFTRTGKLFPGPHLYAGLGLVATMSVMTAFVPYMQKGKEWARQSHFTLAFLAVGLFGWQVKSGMAIVGKLLKWD